MREELPALPALPAMLALLRPQSLAALECQSRLLLQCESQWAVGPQMQVAPPLPHCAGGHRGPSDATGCCQRGPPRIVQVASGLRTPLANDASNPDLASDRQNQSSCATGADFVLLIARVVVALTPHSELLPWH